MLEGATATDLVLTITERLRKHGVVGKFVEFFGPGLEHLTIADRATLGNMCPGIRRDDRDLPDRRDDARLPAAHRRATRRASSWSRRTPGRRACSARAGDPDPIYYAKRSSSISRPVEPSLAGPKRPQDRVSLKQAKSGFQAALTRCWRPRRRRARKPAAQSHVSATDGGDASSGASPSAAAIAGALDHGAVVIAGDHELHEHVEPERDDRRRPASRRRRSSAG